jgi:hypothetical protein
MTETIKTKDESPGGEKWERVLENIVRKSSQHAGRHLRARVLPAMWGAEEL